jgi:hypothetical protein
MLVVLEHTGTPPTIEAGNEELLKSAFASWGMKANLFVVFTMLTLVLFGLLFVITAVLFLFLSLFLFLHRVSWPIVIELLYAAQRYRVLNKGKVLIYLGLFFIMLGTGSRSLAHWLIVKILGI